MSNGNEPKIEYSTNERMFLWTLAAISFLGLNTAFCYGLFFDRDALVDALKNPIAFAFICEAFLLMGALAYLLSKWGVAKLHWGWFVILSLVGSMGFALPVVLLWKSRNKELTRADAPRATQQ